MKKQILSIILFLFSVYNSIGQINIYGEYYERSLPGQKLILYPDNKFEHTFHSCMASYDSKSKGKFQIIKDTIVLTYILDNQKSRTRKYIYNLDTINTSIYPKRNKLRPLIYKYDSSGNDSEIMTFGNLYQEVGYNTNRKVKFSINKGITNTIICLYRQNGYLEIIKRFKKNVPHGEWIYFDRKGILTKIEVYKKGKLKK